MSNAIKYPLARSKLLALSQEDQEDRDPKRLEQILSNLDLTENEWMGSDRTRARELLSILEDINLPSVRNIGLDGSKAAWLIAQHNIEYLSVGIIMLKKMKYLYYTDRNDVYYQGIPFLVDRLMVCKNNWDKMNYQLYGTQAYYDSNSMINYYRILRPKKLGARLKNFNLTLENSRLANG